jgi:hypothetical protein
LQSREPGQQVELLEDETNPEVTQISTFIISNFCGKKLMAR